MKKTIIAILLLAAAPVFAVEKVSGVTPAEAIAASPAEYTGKQVCVSGQVGASAPVPGKTQEFVVRLTGSGSGVNMQYYRKEALAEGRAVIACGIFKDKTSLYGVDYINLLRATSLTLTVAPALGVSTGTATK